MDSDTRRDVSIVKHLTKQFLCCNAITKMNFMLLDENGDYPFDLDIQKQVLDSTINSDLIKQYPIKTSYQKAFLKLFMTKIEESGTEIHDDLYTAYCRLISLQDEESVHYRHFLIENGTSSCITLKESTNLISKGTTGLCSWQGAVVLSDWCAENIKQFQGKNILELGCGVGLTGLKHLLTSSNYAVFAATIRNEDTISQFLEHLGNHNLAFEECISPKWTVLIQSINSPVRILKIFRKI
ncbi:EF2KT methyltransferase [Camponotus japonicus]